MQFQLGDLVVFLQIVTPSTTYTFQNDLTKDYPSIIIRKKSVLLSRKIYITLQSDEGTLQFVVDYFADY